MRLHYFFPLFLLLCVSVYGQDKFSDHHQAFGYYITNNIDSSRIELNWQEKNLLTNQNKVLYFHNVATLLIHGDQIDSAWIWLNNSRALIDKNNYLLTTRYLILKSRLLMKRAEYRQAFYTLLPIESWFEKLDEFSRSEVTYTTADIYIGLHQPDSACYLQTPV